MNSFRPQDFEEVLDAVEHQVSRLIECDHVGSIGGNLNTRGMAFRAGHCISCKCSFSLSER